MRTNPGCMCNLTYNGIETEGRMTGILLTMISCKNCELENSGICFFVSNNLKINAKIEIQMLTINVDTGGNPNLNRIYEIGKININKDPTTNWYIFIFPVACTDVIIEPEIESIKAFIKIRIVKIAV